MSRLASFALLCALLFSGSGCCLFHGACGGCGGGYGGGCGGCPGGACGYGAGYGGYPNSAYAPMGYTGTAMTAGSPIYTAGAPMIAPQTAYAPMNLLPTY